jgi:hypothetical protein
VQLDGLVGVEKVLDAGMDEAYIRVILRNFDKLRGILLGWRGKLLLNLKDYSPLLHDMSMIFGIEDCITHLRHGSLNEYVGRVME